MIDAELDSLIKKSKSYLDSIDPQSDPQIGTLVHRYLCILFSSNIDKSIQLILTEYARLRGNAALRRFVSKKFERGTNYQTEKIIQTLGTFDPDWGYRFSEHASKTDLKEKLDALYGLRNSISHGELVNVSRPSLEGYFQAHARIITFLRDLVLR
jgi:RiboL-PSP-HEPN